MPPKKAKPAPQPGAVPATPTTEEYTALEAQLRDLQYQEAKWTQRLQAVMSRKQKLEAALEETLQECKERQQAIDRIQNDFLVAIEPPVPNSRGKGPAKPRREDAIEQAAEESRLREAGVEFLKRFFRRSHTSTVRKLVSAGTPLVPRSLPRPATTNAAPSSSASPSLTSTPASSPSPSRATTAEPQPRPLLESPRPNSDSVRRRRGSNSAGRRRPEEEEPVPEGVDPGMLRRVRDLRDSRWHQEEALALSTKKVETLHKQLAELQKFEDLDGYAIQATKFRLEPLQKAQKEQLEAWVAEFAPPTPSQETRRFR